MLIEIEISSLDGKSLVIISITPPVKSAGRSALADLITRTFDNKLVGNKSIWIVFLSGSKPGMSTPLRIDFE